MGVRCGCAWLSRLSLHLASTRRCRRPCDLLRSLPDPIFPPVPGRPRPSPLPQVPAEVRGCGAQQGARQLSAASQQQQQQQRRLWRQIAAYGLGPEARCRRDRVGTRGGSRAGAACTIAHHWLSGRLRLRPCNPIPHLLVVGKDCRMCGVLGGGIEKLSKHRGIQAKPSTAFVFSRTSLSLFSGIYLSCSQNPQACEGGTSLSFSPPLRWRALARQQQGSAVGGTISRIRPRRSLPLSPRPVQPQQPRAFPAPRLLQLLHRSHPQPPLNRHLPAAQLCQLLTSRSRLRQL